ncbi:MAG: alpha/beta fold hydrolase [Halioglobus sp.]
MDWNHVQASINGISMHYVDQGGADQDERLPIVMCHGFPHLWFSWHRQMSALAEEGYRVIVPDMRGMGRTEAPSDPRAYDVEHITADLLGLLDHAGVDRAVFVGLDFGAFANYDLALRHPERVLAVIGLENPAAPHNPEESPLTEYRRMGEQHFMHIEYFREPPRADEELGANTRLFLHKVYHTLSGAGNYFDVFKYPPDASYIEAMAEPPPLPWSWLSQDEFDYLVAQYEQSGFTGGLNWYRSMDMKWEQRRPFEGVTSDVPAYFIGSEHDVDLEGFHGDDPIGLMRAIFPQLREVRMIPDAGHMVQLEASDAVNAMLLDYLADIQARLTG